MPYTRRMPDARSVATMTSAIVVATGCSLRRSWPPGWRTAGPRWTRDVPWPVPGGPGYAGAAAVAGAQPMAGAMCSAIVASMRAL
jgi:hypothetical protein